MAQLTLDLLARTGHDFASYFAGANAEAVAAVERWSAAEGPAVVLLQGAAGSGKTHLLHAAIQAADGIGQRTMYVPLREVRTAEPALLADLEALDCVALDDIDTCRGDAGWEQGLFNLYNGLRARGGRLLWATRERTARDFLALPDLMSRVRASLVFLLRELDDADKAEALQALAHQRGLALDGAVADYILRHTRREMRQLTQLLATLDEASLRDGRALTIPFVKSILES